VLDTGTMEFASREAAARSPLANGVRRAGVTSVLWRRFVTVTKDDSDWQHLKPAISAPSWNIICPARRFWPTARPAMTSARRGDEFFNEADADTVATIKDLIETRVRPAVAIDGGDITFRASRTVWSISI